ncbi:MAG: CHRD domain-containing protein [Thermoanaerobaculia bacterium]
MKRLGLILLLLALVPAAHAQSYSAQLTGAAEVPGPGDTDGTGFAVVTINGTTLTYVVWSQNIGTPTAAGIYTGAAGASGAVAVPFTVSTLGSGTTTITQQLANEINANPSGYYVNLQNAEFASGAIRGQLTKGTGDGVRTGYLPVIGKVKGAAGTNFVTDLSILNSGGAVGNVTIDFFAQSAAGQAAPTTTKTVQVAPGEQKVLVDVMQGTLAVADGLGAVKITADQNVLVNGRVINDLRAEAKGTAGFAFEAEESGATSGTMSFLAQDADFRTNIGYFNPSSTPVTATFVARRTSNGAVLGSNSVTIPGYSMVQQAAFALIASVPEADRAQSNFYVTWTSTAPLFVYGAVTDNKTGDAVLNR